MISIRLDGSRAVAVRLESVPERLRVKLNETIHELTDRLLGDVIAAEPERTGKLRAATRESFSDRANLIAGRVRISGRAQAAKAGALEYGAHRSVQVHSYTRTDDILVSGYTRRANIEAHRFLRDPFAHMRAEIDSELLLAVDQVIGEANA